jgi:FlgN protein.
MDELALLCGLLEKQYAVQKKLLELENDKTLILAKGEDSKLDQFIKQEQPLMMETNNLEKQRETLLKKMGMESLTLKETIERTQSPLKSELNDIFRKLSDVLDQLKNVNQFNMKLLNLRLQTVKNINAQLGVQDESVTYKRK